MSGGPYDYAYASAERMAHTILRRAKSTPLRNAFAEHLLSVSAAMKAIEWVDAGDWGDGEDEEPMRDALGEKAAILELEQAIIQAQRVQAELGAALLRAQASVTGDDE